MFFLLIFNDSSSIFVLLFLSFIFLFFCVFFLFILITTRHLKCSRMGVRNIPLSLFFSYTLPYLALLLMPLSTLSLFRIIYNFRCPRTRYRCWWRKSDRNIPLSLLFSPSLFSPFSQFPCSLSLSLTIIWFNFICLGQDISHAGEGVSVPLPAVPLCCAGPYQPH